MALQTMLRPRLPALRTIVMSSLPPPSAYRVPLATSAPSTRACTKRGISSGSAEQSASNMTTTSPVTASKPQASAFPLPLRVWCTTRMSGMSRCAVAMVSSTELPSTRMTSYTGGSLGRMISRLRASFRAGMTTETRGSAGRTVLAGIGRAPVGFRLPCSVLRTWRGRSRSAVRQGRGYDAAGRFRGRVFPLCSHHRGGAVGGQRPAGPLADPRVRIRKPATGAGRRFCR